MRELGAYEALGLQQGSIFKVLFEPSPRTRQHLCPTSSNRMLPTVSPKRC